MAVQQRRERRSKPRSQDVIYRVMVGLAIAGWLSLVIALILYAEAKPEFVSGVQRFWGMEGRTEWREDYKAYLNFTLQFCLITSLIAVVFNARRSRRKGDHFGINLLVLMFISTVSLTTLYLLT